MGGGDVFNFFLQRLGIHKQVRVIRRIFPPLLMAGRPEMTALAGEGKKIFMVAIPALHPGKPMVQVTTFQVAVNDLLEVGPPESKKPFRPLLIDLKKGLKMVLYAPVGIRRLRVPGTGNCGRGEQHWNSIGFQVSCFSKAL